MQKAGLTFKSKEKHHPKTWYLQSEQARLTKNTHIFRNKHLFANTCVWQTQTTNVKLTCSASGDVSPVGGPLAKSSRIRSIHLLPQKRSKEKDDRGQSGHIPYG
ncbi:hypothetical protein AVEN_174447-1 [Araneus ventricosus]|uniref:Uncharacterized protein n=1 Tax=Araneus ventricosus TaxID=182803 RepID=A0A4Y2FU39_ARAVE|nr:hypothetical protein AVEN_174447-1 [Araneus ventricosus]